MILHTALALAVFSICMWAIVSPALHTCIAGTLGLMLIGTAALLSMDYYSQPVVQTMMAGVVFCGVQVIWRVWRVRGSAPRRRATDWADDLEHIESPQEVDEAHQVHIAGGKK
jgi:hypothetical protein